MVRGRSEVWNYFKVEGKRSTCTFCGKEAYKNPSRMPFHLTKCPKCPQPIRQRMLAELPKSLTKSASSPSQCQPAGSHSSNDYENAEIEVLGQEDEVENVVFLSDRYKIHSRKSDENPLTMISEDKSEDEFTLFGNSVAHKLRSINNARARVIAQYYINTVLFRAEMTNFNEEISLPTSEEFALFDSVCQETAKPAESNETDLKINSCTNH